MNSRLLTAAVGLVASLALTAALWLYFDTFLFFLFLPFVPFLFRGGGDGEQPEQTVHECPQCDFETLNDEYDYCPRDGRRLQQSRQTQARDDGWSEL
ncbi:hypothetical protein [Halovenus halobia]|uniref:hypothetical protein n=1 Tax=Halovenus halobia TaxID=3396622 RepID=UPI003F557FDA